MKYMMKKNTLIKPMHDAKIFLKTLQVNAKNLQVSVWSLEVWKSIACVFNWKSVQQNVQVQYTTKMM